MTGPFDNHYSIVCRSVAEGRVVPLLGAGVNRCGRDGPFRPGHTLPDGRELAAYLAEYSGYPGLDKDNLLRVSQYFSAMVGEAPLYDELHELFDVDVPPTPIHDFLAWLPSAQREHDSPKDHPLIVTTNYDDALERTFREAGEPFDLFVYEAVEPGQGRFVHHSPDGDVRPVQKPNEYTQVSLSERPVILKMHGAVDRIDSERDSYVIAEDHYIDYLTRADFSGLVPVTLVEKLRRSHFLFLGYSMRDWNLRVILYRIWRAQKRDYHSWAIQLDPEPIDEKLWGERNVEILDVRLEDYMAELRQRLGRALAAAGR